MQKMVIAVMFLGLGMLAQHGFAEELQTPTFAEFSQVLPTPTHNVPEILNANRSGSFLLINQFGDGSGADFSGEASVAQDFETDYDAFDAAAVDDFTVTSSCKIIQIACGLRAFNGCDPYSITGFGINIHDSLVSAQTNLIGNYASLYVPAEQAGVYPLFSDSYLLYIQEALTGAPLSTLPTLVPGDYWFSIVPINDFGQNGQTAIEQTTIGSPDAFWVNPGGGFGKGTLVPISAPLSYSVIAIETIISVPGDYATIQEAIDAAPSNGATIEVGPGTYNEAVNISGLTGLTLIGTGGPTRTFIKGDGTGTVVTLSDSSGLIDGFTIQNGGGPVGGGMSLWESAFDISNCTITSNNSTTDGGGIVVGTSTANFESVLVLGNSANARGGGVLNYVSDVTFTDCEFIGNICGYLGGGMYLLGEDANHLATTRLIRTEFLGNTAYDSGGAIASVGIYPNPAYSALIIGISEDGAIEGNDCTFIDNHALGVGGNSVVGKGGAIYLDRIEPYGTYVANSVFKGNEAEIGGGAVYFSHSPTTFMRSRFLQNKAENSGGGLELENAVYLFSQVIIDGNEAQRGAGIISNYSANIFMANCVVASNRASATGGGIAMIEGAVDFYNSILWNNSGSSGTDLVGQASGYQDPLDHFAKYSVVQGSDGQSWTDGGGTTWPVLNQDPRFLDLLGPDGIGGTGDEDYRLLATSPCIDAGSNRITNTENIVDFDFNPRFIDDPYTTDTGDIYDVNGVPLSAVIDIGPYEHVANVTGEPGDKIWNCGSWTTWYVYNNDTCWQPEAPMVGDRAILRSGDTGISRSYLTSNMAHDVALVVSDWSFMDLGGYDLDLENDSGAELIVGPYSHSSNYDMTWLEFTSDYLGLGGTVTAEQIEVHGEGRGLLSFHGVTVHTDSINVEFAGRLHLHECAVVRMPSSADPVSISVQGTLDMHFPYWSTVDGNVTFVADENGASSGQKGRLLAQPVPSTSKLFGWTTIFGNVHLGGTLQISTYEMQDSEVGDAIILLEADEGFTDNFDCVISDGFDDDRFVYVTIWDSGDGQGQQLVAHIDSASNLLGFGDPESTDFEANAADAQLADMDGDGDADLVISLTSEDQVIILFNGGNDSAGDWLGFSDGSTNLSIGSGNSTPLGLALGDLGGDSATDIAVACRDSDTVVIFENDSNSGTFTSTSYPVDGHIPPEQTGLNAEPLDVAIGNFDGNNGDNDIAVVNSGDSTIVILTSSSAGIRGMGNGGSIGMDIGGTSVNPGDVNNDKDLDSIIATSKSNGQVADVKGQTAFRDYTEIDYYDVGVEPEELVVGDLNSDGMSDLATADSGGGTISVLIQNTDGTYASSVSFAIGTDEEFPRSLALGDYDVDGDLDLAVVVYNSDTDSLIVRTLRNDSVGGVLLLSEDTDYGQGTNPSLVRSADVNGDSATDMVVINSTDNGFRDGDNEAATFVSNYSRNSCDADVNGDGSVDVDDLLVLIGAWGPCSGCDSDINSDGSVDVDDLLLLIGAWGPC